MEFHVYRTLISLFIPTAMLFAQSMSFDLLTIPTAAPPQSFAAGDFNGDGKVDLAVTENSSVEILLNSGGGSFRSAAVIPVGAAATRILGADLNRDGIPDLVVAVGSAGHVVVLYGNGDGSFRGPADAGAQSPSGVVAGSGVPPLAAGDVDGDGIPDLILGPYTLASSSLVSVLRGNADGTFQPAVNTTLNRVDVPKVAVVDYNGDGQADLFVTGVYPYQISPTLYYGPAGLLTGNSDGTFAVSYWNSDLSDGFPPVAVDLNGNGKPDLVFVNTIAAYPWLRLNEFLDGSLTLTRQTVDGPVDNFIGEMTALAAGDLNGDGNADLVLIDTRGDAHIAVGAGDGSFHTVPDFPQPTSYVGGTSSTTTYSDPYGSLTVADIYGNGHPAILVAIAGSHLAVLKNGASTAPVLSAAAVVNTATMTAGPAEPGSLMTIFGTNLAYGSGALQAATDIIGVTGDFAPNSLYGARVYLNGIRAPMLYASPTQINIQVPWELAGQTQAVLAVTRNGISQAISIPIGSYFPGLFTMTESGSGQVAASIVGTASIPAPSGAFPGSRPVHRGEFLALYGTGLGPLDRGGFATGEITPLPSYYETNGGPLRNTTTMPVITFGGVPGTVQFSGFAPLLIGVYQVNVQIPANAPTGDAIPLQLSIGGLMANTVTVAIQ
jgi:uncharacterized protein (TIGR03437 family)